MRIRNKTMNSIWKAIICSGILLFASGCQHQETPENASEDTVAYVDYASFEATIDGIKTTEMLEDGTEGPVTLLFWYNDKAQAPYYEAAAADFFERYGVMVQCEYIEDVAYLEAINTAQIERKGPDVFISSNDQVRKAYLAGLTAKNALYTDEFWNEHFADLAYDAFTTDGKQVGYPIYMDTCMMIYDTAITEKPNSFADITDFAVNFEDETNSKVLFRWDISDPYCDCLYLGSGAKLFGQYGEDTSAFDVSNASVIQNMTYYQTLREYFSLEVETSSYNQLKTELENGDLVYGIVKTDVLSELSSYGSSYALSPVPMLSDELSVQDLSLTYGAFVSSYTKKSEFANLFAAYLSYEYAENVFGLAHRVAVRSDISHSDANEMSIYEQYCNSIPSPKVLENGDFWIYTEICFKNIWNGKDVSEEMNKLQEQMDIRLK